MTESNYDRTKQSARHVLTELNLSEQTCAKCLGILKRSRNKNILTARNADGIIAGSIYIAAIMTENRITQRSIADVMDISEATIRKYYVLLVKALDLKEKKTDFIDI